MAFEGISLDRFDASVEKEALSPKGAASIEGAMKILYLIAYSPYETTGEVNFDSFSIVECEDALEQILEYESDEFSEETANLDNFITEINRVAHVSQIVGGLSKTKRKAGKRKFF